MIPVLKTLRNDRCATHSFLRPAIFRPTERMKCSYLFIKNTDVEYGKMIFCICQMMFAEVHSLSAFMIIKNTNLKISIFDKISTFHVISSRMILPEIQYFQFISMRLSWRKTEGRINEDEVDLFEEMKILSDGYWSHKIFSLKNKWRSAVLSAVDNLSHWS